MCYNLYNYRRVGRDLKPTHVEGFDGHNTCNLRDFYAKLGDVTQCEHAQEPGPHPELFVQRPLDIPAARKLLAELGGNSELDALLVAMESDPDLFYEVSN